jgi:hypothetical protein
MKGTEHEGQDEERYNLQDEDNVTHSVCSEMDESDGSKDKTGDKPEPSSDSFL